MSCDFFQLTIHTTFILTVFSAINSGLSITVSPRDNEFAFEMPFRIFRSLDSRVGVESGSSIGDNLLVCEVKPPGSSRSDPSVYWVKNGEAVTNGVSVSNVTGDVRSVIDVVYANLSHAGEYQCIVIDSDDDAEVITTMPFQIDTGIIITTVTKL